MLDENITHHLADGSSLPEIFWNVLARWAQNFVIDVIVIAPFCDRKQRLESTHRLSNGSGTPPYTSVQDLRLRWSQRLSPNPPARSGCPGRQALSSSASRWEIRREATRLNQRKVRILTCFNPVNMVTQHLSHLEKLGSVGYHSVNMCQPQYPWLVSSGFSVFQKDYVVGVKLGYSIAPEQLSITVSWYHKLINLMPPPHGGTSSATLRKLPSSGTAELSRNRNEWSKWCHSSARIAYIAKVYQPIKMVPQARYSAISGSSGPRKLIRSNCIAKTGYR